MTQVWPSSRGPVHSKCDPGVTQYTAGVTRYSPNHYACWPHGPCRARVLEVAWFSVPQCKQPSSTCYSLTGHLLQPHCPPVLQCKHPSSPAPTATATATKHPSFPAPPAAGLVVPPSPHGCPQLLRLLLHAPGGPTVHHAPSSPSPQPKPLRP